MAEENGNAQVYFSHKIVAIPGFSTKGMAGQLLYGWGRGRRRETCCSPVVGLKWNNRGVLMGEVPTVLPPLNKTKNPTRTNWQQLYFLSHNSLWLHASCRELKMHWWKVRIGPVKCLWEEGRHLSFDFRNRKDKAKHSSEVGIRRERIWGGCV